MSHGSFARTRLIILAWLAQLKNLFPNSYEHHSDAEKRRHKKAPAHRYKNYHHSTQEQHRTAEEVNWRRQNIWTRVAVVFAAGAFGATFTQAWIARDTERQQLRAYVSVDPTNKPILVLGQPAIADVELRNSGQTPARDIALCGNIIIVTNDEITSAANDPTVYDYEVSLGSIFPGKERVGHLTTSNAVTQPDLNAVGMGDKFILIYGTITYKDAFGTKNTYTNYCYYYVANDDQRQNAQFCMTHNDAH